MKELREPIKFLKSFISPNFPAEKLETGKIEDWIDVFEDRITNWIFKQARALLSVPDSEYAITQLLVPYFESITMYIKGEDSRGKSRQFFKEGFKTVFSSPKNPEHILLRIADVLYEDARCGFFHDNMIRSKIFFADAPLAPGPVHANLPKVNGRTDFGGNISAIIINAEEFLDEVKSHFRTYINQLRDKNNHNLREKFKTIWLKKNPPGLTRQIGDFMGSLENYRSKL